jgi:transcriptional regulator
MYTPSYNQFTDQQEVIAFMQRYSFATLVSVEDSIPLATHLPFVIKQDGDKIKLVSHLAKVNPQIASITTGKVMVIFMEPHAYISPSNYQKHESVPTWNYLAVHAYGNCTLIESTEDKIALLEETIKFYDADYIKQWATISDDYKQKTIKGFVAFEITVEDIKSRKKLSQEKPEHDKERIVTKLSASENTNERDIAEYMSSLGLKH